MNFRIYPTTLRGLEGPTGPAGIGGGGPITLTAGEDLMAGDVVKLNTSGEVVTFPGMTDVTYESASAHYISSCYDPSSDRIVIVYSDVGNSDRGTAVVGNVTGETITFGTPVVFNNGGVNHISCVYDASAEGIVIAYLNGGNSDYGTAIVGQVNAGSETITFGTPVVFESAISIWTSCAYDSVSERVVIAYLDGGNSEYGTAVVGNVSGTAITFGTPVVFNSASSTYNSCVHDTTSDRVVISYRNGSDRGASIIGNVNTESETITFGTEVVFSSGDVAYISSVYDSTNNRVVIAYQDDDRNSYGTAIVGNVNSGSETITFGTTVVFQRTDSRYFSSAYNSTADRVVFFYYDVDNFNYGMIVVGDVNATTETITFTAPFSNAIVQAFGTSCVYDSTAERTVLVQGSVNLGFATVLPDAYLTGITPLGIANENITSGDTGEIVINGIDTNQSGLTSGTYYKVNYLTGLLEATPTLDVSKLGYATTATNLFVSK